MNQTFKRYRLLDDEEFERKQKQLRVYDPEIAVAATKQTTIDDVMSNPKMNAEEKLRLIRILYHSLKPVEQTIQPAARPKTVTVAFQQPGFKTEIPAPALPPPPIPVALVAAPLPVAVAAPGVGPPVAAAAMPPLEPEREDEFADAEENKFAALVSQLPPSYQAKATEIARILDHNSRLITYNDDLELIIGKVNTPHSNIVNLIKYLFNSRNQTPPLGYASFLTFLAQLKVPPNLVSNKKAQEFLASALQSGHGKRKIAIGYAKRPQPKHSKRVHSPISFKSLNLYK